MTPALGAAVTLCHSFEFPSLDSLQELQLEVAIEDKEGEYPSSTILVNAVDVMGAPTFMAAGCRLDVPTKHRLLVALRNT